MPPRPKMPDSMLELTENLTISALPDSAIASLAALAEASPEEFQKAAAAAFQRLVIEGFRTLQAPRNWKEQATAVDLWRKCGGIDKVKDGGMPVGLVGVLRQVNRRVGPILDAPGIAPDDGEPEFD